MRITINGTARETDTTTLAAALTQAGLTGHLATALNGTFIPVALRETTPVHEGDAIDPPLASPES